ncbi:MAG: hypothetical protein KAT25_01950 [Sulfuriflexus sp.]|nr:hypothetical protein [Sulfuriflexus sp.]
MNKIVINFISTLNSWGESSFNTKLIGDIMALPKNTLPLQKALSQGDMASERPDKISIMSSEETATEINIKLGVFFTEIISGCSCGDDPGSLNGYCEMQLTIDRLDGNAEFKVTG